MIRCELGWILGQYGIARAAFEDAADLHQAESSRIVNGRTLPKVPKVLTILSALETLTGKQFDVRDVWRAA